MRFKYSIFLCLFISYYCYGYTGNKDGDTVEVTSFYEWLNEAYKYPKKLINYTLLEINYGYSLVSINDTKFKSNLSPVFCSEFKYGFIRINDDIGANNRFYVASENVFVSSYAAHFKPSDSKLKGITTDGWSFGFSFKNGFGYEFWDDRKLTLYHTGSLVLSRIDVELESPIPKDEKKLDDFDEKFRFGSSFECGANFEVFNFMHFDLAYNHQLVFPGSYFWGFAGSSLLELLFQRGIDYLAMRHLKDYPDEMPAANFIGKNLISVMFYELRRKNMHWPLKSDIPLNYDTFKIGFTFIF